MPVIYEPPADPPFRVVREGGEHVVTGADSTDCGKRVPVASCETYEAAAYIAVLLNAAPEATDQAAARYAAEQRARERWRARMDFRVRAPEGENMLVWLMDELDRLAESPARGLTRQERVVLDAGRVIESIKAHPRAHRAVAERRQGVPGQVPMSIPEELQPHVHNAEYATWQRFSTDGRVKEGPRDYHRAAFEAGASWLLERLTGAKEGQEVIAVKPKMKKPATVEQQLAGAIPRDEVPGRERRLVSVASTEPTHWWASVLLPDNEDDAWRWLASLWDHGEGHLARPTQDFLSGRNLRAFAKQHAGKRVRLSITMEAVDD